MARVWQSLLVGLFLFGMGIMLSLSQGCAPALTPLQQQQRASLDNMPLTFQIAKANSDDVWGKAQVWLTKYAPFKLQTTTDFVLQTYSPPSDSSSVNQYAYQVTREPNGETDTYTIVCQPTIGLWDTYAVTNAKVLAKYLISGENYTDFITPAP